MRDGSKPRVFNDVDKLLHMGRDHDVLVEDHEEIPAVLCAHANECPAVCPCPPNCYCRRVGSAPSCKRAKGGGVRNTTTPRLDFPECKVPPPGWRCTRGAGHEGPCATVPASIALGSGRRAAGAVFFACGCSESTIDGVLTRRYCPNGECRKLTR